MTNSVLDALAEQKALLSGDIDSSNERIIILKTYRILYKIGLSSPHLDESYLRMFKKAFRFVLESTEKLPSRFRKTSLFHTLEIAVIIAEKFQLGIQAITAALLYGLYNNKQLPVLSLREAFGEDFVTLVKELTKMTDNTLTSVAYDCDRLATALQVFTPDNCLIVLISLAELLSKAYKIDELGTDEKNKLMELSHDIYIPLAHRLGLSSVYLELEDLYLSFKHKIVYDTIIKKLKIEKTSPIGFLESFTASIAENLDQQGVRYVIKGRTKSIASICHKVKKRGIAFENIHDFYAIRIIFDTSLEQEYSDCWRIYEAVTKLYEPKLTNLRDWVSYPKESGYEALHITVLGPGLQWVEVQIRAKRMDEKAEYGDAAHWKYKSSILGGVFKDMDETWIEKARTYLASYTNKDDKKITISVNKIYLNNI